MVLSPIKVEPCVIPSIRRLMKHWRSRLLQRGAICRGGIEAAVVCPEDVDPNEWIAVHGTFCS